MNYSNNSSKLKLFIQSFPFLFLIFSCIQLNAQITIEENIFTDLIGKQYKEVLYETELDIDGELAGLKAAIGPNQIWEFSGLNYIDSTVTLYEVMVIDPNDPLLAHPELANSQYINKVTLLPGSGGVMDTFTTYLYTSLQDGDWEINGAFTLIDLDLDGVLDSTFQFFTPPSLELRFPVTSTSFWTDSTSLITIFDGMEFVGSIAIDTSIVQGYGTLITPYGNAEALRVHNKSITTVPFTPIIDVSNDYDFVTEDNMMSASIVVEDGRAFYTVRSMVAGPSSTFNLVDINFAVTNVYPNPFQNNIQVDVNIIKNSEVDISIINLDGKRTTLINNDYLPIGQHTINLSTRDIPSGLYILEVRSGRFIQHLPVSRI